MFRIKFILPLALFCVWSCVSSLMANIHVSYHYPADAFNLIEQISGAAPEFFLDEKFKKEWVTRFPLTEIEEQMLTEYRSIRKSQQGDKWWERNPADFDETPDGLFAPAPKETEDPVAHAFYSAASFEEAWKNLAVVVDRGTLNFFQDFFAAFRSKIDQVLSESHLYNNYAQDLNRLVNGEVEAIREIVSTLGYKLYLDSEEKVL
jgi:malate synthase